MQANTEPKNGKGGNVLETSRPVNNNAPHKNKNISEIIDSEESNRALAIVEQLKRKATHDAIISIQRVHGLIWRSA